MGPSGRGEITQQFKIYTHLHKIYNQELSSMMLFEPMMFVAGGATIALACLDKTLENYGFHALGTFLKIAIPLAGLIAGVYFIETNPLLEWLK